MLVDVLLKSVVLVPLLCFFLSILYRRRTKDEALPDNLPWVGCRNELFSKVRAHLRDWKQGARNLEEGYAKYSKHGRAFAAPNILGKPAVMLPRRRLTWLLKQPSDVVSVYPMRNESMGLTYMAPTQLLHTRFGNEIIRNDLVRNLDLFTPGMVEDICNCLDELWGTDTENWKDVQVYKTLQQVTYRAVNRVFVGEPLCHDKGYLKAVQRYVDALGATTAAIAMSPDILKPALGHVLALPARFLEWRCTSRLAAASQHPPTTSTSTSISTGKPDSPPALLDWLLASTQRSPSAAERAPSVVVARLLLLNFAAIHTTTLTLLNCLFDLVSTPDALSTLRAEALAVQHRHAHTTTTTTTDDDDNSNSNNDTNAWSRAAVASLHKADSALRETLRRTGFAGRGLVHEVLRAEGVRLPDGVVLPRGAWVGAPIGRIHLDGEIYERPGAYDPFRFSRAREEMVARREAAKKEEVGGEDKEVEGEGARRAGGGSSIGGVDEEAVLRERKLALVATEEPFLAFGHGKDACPGRFFAAHQMKLMLALIVLRYDIKPLETRPVNKTVSDISVPPMDATLSVRRRRRDDAEDEQDWEHKD